MSSSVRRERNTLCSGGRCRLTIARIASSTSQSASAASRRSALPPVYRKLRLKIIRDTLLISDQALLSAVRKISPAKRLVLTGRPENSCAKSVYTTRETSR